jgi:iron complex outermembrane recepter protein
MAFRLGTLAFLTMAYAGVGAFDTASAREDVFDFNVPRSTADITLSRIAEQSGTLVLFPFDRVNKVEANEVDGELTVTQALAVALRGTRLRASLTSDGVITVSLSPGHEQDEGRDDMQGRRAPLLASLAALAWGALGANGWAQDAPANDDSQEIVVIGTPGGAGTNRFAASFAVTTLNADDIDKIAPLSTADLFHSIPGVWVESSGGVAGANIDVRGLPGGSDAPFVTLAINGSPLYGTEMLSFMEQSSIFRVDETIAGVEGLRGGPNSVFGKGEPGLTVNFNLRQGGEDTQGSLKYSTSDYDEQRIDAWMSGKLADNLYYMIGGFAHSSPGIRDTQFDSEVGNQFTVNLTRKFDNGEVDVFSRVTDDHGQWVLPMALNTGNDLGTFAQLGNATRYREIQTDTAGDTQIFDFGDGRGWKGSVSGGHAQFDLGDGFTLNDRFTYTKGNADTYGFVPAGSPVTAAALSTAIGGGPVTTASGATLAPTDYVQTYGHWVVQKDIESLINDLSINKTFAGGHDVTLGYYRATWSSDDLWFLGNPIPVQNIANGEPLDASITPADVAAAGGDAGFAFGLKSSGDARTYAFYLADSWQATDRLRIDAGARRESIDIDYLLDTGPGYPDGATDMNTSVSGDEWAYTIAGNYDVASNLGVFVRYTDGFRFPNFDDIRGGSNAVNGVTQLEGGVKFSGPWLELYATAFHNKNDSFNSVVGSTVAAAAFTTQANGLELDGNVSLGDFSTSVNATFQKAEIKESTTASDVGNKVLRQPDWQARISPSYRFALGAGLDATVYGALTFVGHRYGDNANTVDLPSYEKYDLGVIVDTPSGLFFQVHGDNLSDSHGITEGDPRNPAAPNGRPIFGRSVLVSVGYNF